MKLKNKNKDKKKQEWIGYRAEPEDKETFKKIQAKSSRSATSLIKEALHYFYPLWEKKYK